MFYTYQQKKFIKCIFLYKTYFIFLAPNQTHNYVSENIDSQLSYSNRA
jgi:hypothetical protein